MPDIKLLAAFMKDFWQLMKEHPPDKDIDWENLIWSAGSLGRKYGATRNGTRVQLIYYNLINALLDALEGRAYECNKKV